MASSGWPPFNFTAPFCQRRDKSSSTLPDHTLAVGAKRYGHNFHSSTQLKGKLGE